MFEKEAENSFNCKKVLYKWETDKHSYIDGFKDGATFGYDKANEWHFVKDSDLPKYEKYVLIYTSLKNTYVARIPTQKYYFITNKGGYVQMSSVIAWKEIILPELKGELK